MSGVVFHFTSTLNLPWIITDGVLRPASIVDIGIGHTCLIWATTDPSWNGRATHPGFFMKYFPASWRSRSFALVRLTLPDDRFHPLDAMARRLGWRDSELWKMEMDDRLFRHEFGHAHWRCRDQPLPLSAVLKAEARTCGGRWQPIELAPEHVVKTRNPERMGYRIGSKTFLADRKPCNNIHGYAYLPPVKLIPRKPIYVSKADRLADAAFVARQEALERWEDGGDDEFWDH